MALVVIGIVLLLPAPSPITNGHLGPADAGADRRRHHARLPDRVHADGHGHVLRVARLSQREPGIAIRQTLDLMVQRAYSVMTNDVLISVPLFVFMGYLVERANLIEKLFRACTSRSARMPGSLAVATLVTCAIFATATGIVGAVVTLMGLLALPGDAEGRLQREAFRRRDHCRRLPRHPDSAVGAADRVWRDRGRVGGAALRRRFLSRAHAGRPVHRLRDHAGEAAGPASRRRCREAERRVPLPASAQKRQSRDSAARSSALLARDEPRNATVRSEAHLFDQSAIALLPALAGRSASRSWADLASALSTAAGAVTSAASSSASVQRQPSAATRRRIRRRPSSQAPPGRSPAQRADAPHAKAAASGR